MLMPELKVTPNVFVRFLTDTFTNFLRAYIGSP